MQTLSSSDILVKKRYIRKGHTFDMSQAITEGSLDTRSMEKTLFFTFFARRASPGIQRRESTTSAKQTGTDYYDYLVHKLH